MRNKPVIVAAANPLGVDKVVKEFQDLLSGLYYFDNGQKLWFEEGLIFGLAEKVEEKPVILWKNKDFYNLSPNDNFRSYAFFHEHDSREQINEYTKYDLSLIVWFNQDRFKKLDYRIREYLINQVQNAVKQEVEDLTIFTGKDNVFAEYKIKPEYKFDGFRVRFTVERQIDCGQVLDITSTEAPELVVTGGDGQVTVDF